MDKVGRKLDVRYDTVLSAVVSVVDALGNWSHSFRRHRCMIVGVPVVEICGKDVRNVSNGGYEGSIS